MTSFPDISISTERLILRHYEEEDLPALTEMMNDELVTAWTSAPHPYTEAHARHWVAHAAPAERVSGRGVVFAISECLTQRLVGTLQLRATDWRCRSTEVSYLIAPWARGEGYACEAVLGCAQWLFAEQDCERMELRTAADNAAAQQVAQKVGCVSEGVLRSAGTVRCRGEDGNWTRARTDLILWSLLPEDLDTLPRRQAGASGHPAYHDWR
jgi:RimJ/RimL family protein N-acetyltransferase